MQLNEIRKELKFNGELLNLIETLKNIAASQYHLMEKEKERFEAFMDAFAGFFRVVNLVNVDDPLVRTMSDTTGIVVVTSDSGFMGGLNQGVLRRALETQGALPNERTALVVIGDKGASALADQDREFTFFPGIDREKIYESAVAVKTHIVRETLARRMGRTIVVYPRPVSFSSQTIEAAELLPCGKLFDAGAESEMSRHGAGKGFLARSARVVVESSYTDMVEYLAGMWVTSRLFEIFEDSKLAEFSARAMHLEGSFEKVGKEHKRVKHLAAKASHEQIDKGMRESFSATKSKRGRARRTANAAARAGA